MIEAIHKSWIRVRYTHKRGWDVQPYELTNQAKNYIWNLFFTLLKKEETGINTEVHILSIADGEQSSLSSRDIIRGKLYLPDEFKVNESRIN